MYPDKRHEYVNEQEAIGNSPMHGKLRKGGFVKYVYEPNSGTGWNNAIDQCSAAIEEAFKMRKGTYLLQSQWHLLQDWGQDIDDMFGDVPFQVGSSLLGKEYRDVDVRLILSDSRYDTLNTCLDIERLNDIVSMWGQQVTGLPIDFQVQRRTEANAEWGGRPRNALFRAKPTPANGKDGMSESAQAGGE